MGCRERRVKGRKEEKRREGKKGRKELTCL
jgi:hypothetical protein